MEFKVGCSYETHDFDVVMKFTVKKITDFCLLVDVYEPEYLKEKDMMIGLDSFLAYNAKLISASEEIHITVKGDKTYAVLKENGKVTKRSVAKCSLNDDFNFETGAKVAFERLFEKNSNASELKTLYLKNKFTNEIYGAIGEETQLRDINDEHLCIGDVVEVFEAMT